MDGHQTGTWHGAAHPTYLKEGTGDVVRFYFAVGLQVTIMVSMLSGLYKVAMWPCDGRRHLPTSFRVTTPCSPACVLAACAQMATGTGKVSK